MKRAPETTSKGVRPIQAFAIVAGLLIAIGVTWLLTKPETNAETEPAAAGTTTDFSLTDQQAIARFKQLDRLRVEAIDSADVSLLDQVFTPDSDINGVTAKNIQRLNRSGVTAVHNPYETKRLSVLTNTENSITLEQVVVFNVRFQGPSGKDLTQRGGLEQQTIVWSLLRRADNWLIDAARVVKSKAL